MTKGELLRFLEPFADEVQIVVKLEDLQVAEPAPVYSMSPLVEHEQNEHGHSPAVLRDHGITPGDGYVLL